MPDIATLDDHIAAARAALAEEDRTSAQASLFDAAQIDPLSEPLHELLPKVWSEEPPNPDHVAALQSSRFDLAVRVWELVKHRRIALFGLLPALGCVDEGLLELKVPPLNQPKGREVDHWIRFDTAAKLGGKIPVHEPVREGFTTYTPTRSSIQKGVLRMEQLSRYHHKPREIGNEHIVFIAYRVRGLLFHARWRRFYHWSQR